MRHRGWKAAWLVMLAMAARAGAEDSAPLVVEPPIGEEQSTVVVAAPIAEEPAPQPQAPAAEGAAQEPRQVAEPAAEPLADEPTMIEEPGSILMPPSDDDADVGDLLASDPFGHGTGDGGCLSCTGGCTGCGGRGCLPVGETWWLFDVVFLQRDNQSTDQIIAASGPDAIITSGGPQFTTQPGVRLFRGSVDDCGRGWELGYLGVWNMFAGRTAAGPGDVHAGDPLALVVEGFNDRSLAEMTYLSSLNTAEASYLVRSCHRGFSRMSAYPWERCGNYRRGTVDWLAGFRWAGLDERAGLVLSGGDFAGPSRYDVRSSTNFFGAQLGGRGRMEWDRWAIDGWAKVALAGTAMSQSADPIVSAIPPNPTIRPARAASEGGVGFIGDIAVNLSYRLSDTWRLRTGYNFLWLTGVALAPNQMDFGGSNTGGTGLAGGAGVFLSGANLGLEAAW